MFAQIIVAADALAIDKGLRRRLDAVLFLERVGLLARFEMMVLDLEAFALQQVDRLEAVGTDVFGHHHPIDGGLPGGRAAIAHDALPWLAG